MKKDVSEIYHEFNGKLVGTKRMKLAVCEVLSEMPKNITSKITKTCWFMSSLEDAWAFTFTGDDLKSQHLIFLSDDLLLQNKKQIYHSIAHEIGHVILGHRNSVLERQSKKEIRKQEKEADLFAREFGF
ncbi:MAG: ImmA/IrrE family metallo-endopeptidase [Candidatus Levybacteria bacterium]|nr:ImmA/IrrE family metallo-endopeptidase [Candidatus Levybacteria bacterium]